VNRTFALTLAACAAGLSPVGAAVMTVPLSAVPVSAPAFSVAASIAIPALAPSIPLQALALTPSLLAAPLLAAPNISPIAAAPAAAPALPALRAAATPDEPGDPKRTDAPKTPESEQAAASARFDGAASSPEAVAEPAKAPPVAAKLGDGLRAADEADEPWLVALVGTLSQSKTGRRILRDIAALEKKRGHPTLVVVKKISNNGEFRYDSDLLVMDQAHRRKDPLQTAPIFAHELQHVLQRDLGLPVDALELEIESYTIESRVWSELGVEPPPNSFARQARARILRDTDEFIAWLNLQYNENRALHGGTDVEYLNWLKYEQLPKLERRVKRAEKNLRAAQRVVERMKAEGKPEAAVRSFIQDDVEPVERLLRGFAAERAWNERDLAMLSTPEGRALFRKYSQGVIRRARTLSRS
jgi:hypothetical protein